MFLSNFDIIYSNREVLSKFCPKKLRKFCFSSCAIKMVMKLLTYSNVIHRISIECISNFRSMLLQISFN